MNKFIFNSKIISNIFLVNLDLQQIQTQAKSHALEQRLLFGFQTLKINFWFYSLKSFCPNYSALRHVVLAVANDDLVIKRVAFQATMLGMLLYVWILAITTLDIIQSSWERERKEIK